MAMVFKSTDLPAPVGPTIMAWPTSPWCRSKRKGVVPAVRVTINGGCTPGWPRLAHSDDRCALRDGPGQIADIGIMSQRFNEDTSGRRRSA